MSPSLKRIRGVIALFTLLAGVTGCVNPRLAMPVSKLPDPAPPAFTASAPELATPTAIIEMPRLAGVETGLASYYHPSLDGGLTASGVTFDNATMMAAHPTFPLGTVVRVKNLENAGAEVEVRITDRGPTHENVAEGVVIDLSGAAAAHLGMIRDGRVLVQLKVLEWGSNRRIRPQ